MTPEARASSIELPDGRRLGYADVGDPQGRPLLYFHGFPGSRLDGRLVDAAAARNGIRIVVVERPGYGLSDFKPGRRIRDWPDDVVALANALGIERFSVAGASGGGPYALVCAHAIAERLEGVGVICGLGPLDAPRTARGMIAFNRVGLLAVRRAPWIARLALTCARPAFRHFSGVLVDRLAKRTGPADRGFFARREYRQIFADTFREAFRSGARGPAWDLRLLSRPWGFELGAIRIPVRLWHGEEDVVVPPAMGRAVAAAVPFARATFYPGEGHFSLAIGRAEEMLRQVRVVAGDRSPVLQSAPFSPKGAPMADSPPPAAKRRSFTSSCLLIVAGLGGVAALLLVGWIALALAYSYSEGDRAGYVQKFSRKGWVCKTWEGELAMANLPGAMPEIFAFTVTEDAVAQRITASMGQRVSLHYEEHRGLPTSCFGDTVYFVNDIRPVAP